MTRQYCVKRSYSSEEEAEATMKYIVSTIPKKERGDWEGVTIYFCNFHNAWHLGHG